MSDSFYRSKEWRALRAATLRRDPVCKVRGCGRPASHADHIIERERGGADTLDNLRGLCRSCHNRRSARGGGDPRAVGCKADGTPRDPGHPWLTWGDSPRNIVASSPENFRPGDRTAGAVARALSSKTGSGGA